MKLKTVGQIHNPNLKLPLFVDQRFDPVIVNESCYRIIFFKKGTGIINIADTRIVLLTPTILCLNEREEISLLNQQDLQTEILYFNPNIINDSLTYSNIQDKELITKYIDKLDSDTFIPFYHRDKAPAGQLNLNPSALFRMNELFQHIHDELNHQKTRYWPCQSRGYLTELLFFITRLFNMRSNQDEWLVKSNEENLYPVIVYLFSHYQTKITITDLTKRFNINRNSLSKKFYQLTGYSVIDYLIKIRISVACRLLNETQLSISEILEKVGFIDITHFTRMFKKYMGCSPSQYRKSLS